MALTYTTLNVTTLAAVLRYITNVWFIKDPLLNILMEKMETFDGIRIEVPLEYADPDLSQFTGRMVPFNVGLSSPLTKAYYDPKTNTTPLAIPWEDKVDNKGEGKIFDVVTVLTENLIRSVRHKFATAIWTRSTPGANDFHSLDQLIGTGTIGGIAPADMGTSSLWQSQLIDVVATYNDDPAVETNLLDENSDVYILNLLERATLLASYLDEGPDIGMTSPYLFSIARRAFFRKFGGSPVDKRMVNAGIEHIVYLNTTWFASHYCAAAQTGDTDGRIYAISTDAIKYRFNSEAKPFVFETPVTMQNVNADVHKLLCRGNMVISNRRRCCRLYNGIKSPKAFAAPA